MNPTRLMYSKSNQAFVFVFGDQLLRMGNNRMFYRNKADAIRAALAQGLVVDKKGFVTSVDGGTNGVTPGPLEGAARTASLRTPVGTRVVFRPNPASHLLYSNPPEVGEEGEVTTVAHIGGRRSFMKGPGGGLLYVKWDRLGTMGVAPQDAELVGRGRGGSKLDQLKAKLSRVQQQQANARGAVNKAEFDEEIAWLQRQITQQGGGSAAPQGPASGFGKERTREDYVRRIAWEAWAEQTQRAQGHNANADGHALARREYEDKLRLRFRGLQGIEENPVVAVIFRVWKKEAVGGGYAPSHGGVIALFPYQDVGGGFISSYEHIGQHGAADYMGTMQRTRPAKPEEYAALKRELESPPYNYRFRVIKRRQRGGSDEGTNGVEGITDDDDFEPVSMSYGEMPARAQFLEQTKDEFPYPMELVGEDKKVIEAINALDMPGVEEFMPEYPHKLGVRVQSAEAMYGFLTALKDLNDSDDALNDAAGSLASSIMGTLGYEWI